MGDWLIDEGWRLGEALSSGITTAFWILLWWRVYRNHCHPMASSGRPRQLWVTLVCLFGLWVCLHGWPVLPWLGFDAIGVWVWRGLWGDLSVASWCVIVFWGCSRRSLASGPWRLWFAGLALLGLFVYPLMLGVGLIDPYAWGYADPWLLAAVLSMMILALWFGVWLVFIWGALAVSAWQLQLYDSRNLWDYLMDPIAWLVAMLYTIHQQWRAIRTFHLITQGHPSN